MDEAFVVRVVETRAQVLHQGQLAHNRQVGPSTDHLAKRFALDVLHGDKRLALVLTNVVDGDDVRVLEPTGGASLSQEARTRFLFCRPSGA